MDLNKSEGPAGNAAEPSADTESSVSVRTTAAVLTEPTPAGNSASGDCDDDRIGDPPPGQQAPVLT
jgi:hypothetical protein